MELDQAIRRDTLANRPAATAVPPGTLYGVTDEGNRVDRSNGLAWEPYGATGSGGGAPDPHHATHEPGGSDPMAVDAAAATGSLRTLGTGANQAAPGDDARFTAPSAPTAHHATHEPGGADALVNAAWTNVGNLFTQTQIVQGEVHVTGGRAAVIGPAGAMVELVDQAQPVNQKIFRLHDTAQALSFSAITDDFVSTLATPLTLDRAGNATVGNNLTVTGSGGNVACKNQTNVFTQDQWISKTSPQLLMHDSAPPANARLFRVMVANQWLAFDALDDAVSGLAGRCYMTRPGDWVVGQDLYEKGRLTPLGHWIDVPYTGQFSGSGGMTWTVESGDVSVNQYTVIGKTFLWQVHIDASSLSGVADATLYISTPSGITLQSGSAKMTLAYDGVTHDARVQVSTGITAAIIKSSGAPWTLGTNLCYVYFTLIARMA